MWIGYTVSEPIKPQSRLFNSCVGLIVVETLQQLGLWTFQPAAVQCMFDFKQCCPSFAWRLSIRQYTQTDSVILILKKSHYGLLTKQGNVKLLSTGVELYHKYSPMFRKRDQRITQSIKLMSGWTCELQTHHRSDPQYSLLQCKLDWRDLRSCCLCEPKQNSWNLKSRKLLLWLYWSINGQSTSVSTTW